MTLYFSLQEYSEFLMPSCSSVAGFITSPYSRYDAFRGKGNNKSPSEIPTLLLETTTHKLCFLFNSKIFSSVLVKVSL